MWLLRVTVSPSRFKVLETLNEENELLEEGEFLVEEEDTRVDESAKEGHDRVLANKTMSRQARVVLKLIGSLFERLEI